MINEERLTLLTINQLKESKIFKVYGKEVKVTDFTVTENALIESVYYSNFLK